MCMDKKNGGRLVRTLRVALLMDVVEQNVESRLPNIAFVCITIVQHVQRAYKTITKNIRNSAGCMEDVQNSHLCDYMVKQAYIDSLYKKNLEDRKKERRQL